MSSIHKNYISLLEIFSNVTFNALICLFNSVFLYWIYGIRVDKITIDNIRRIVTIITLKDVLIGKTLKGIL